MPPKGWRKNAEGQYPQPNKDSELVSIDDILFPRSTVQKIAKTIISEDDSNMILAKDSLTALQRSATVFVSHVLFHARQLSKEGSRKTINTQDILHALEKAEFSGFVPEVKHKLSSHEANVALKKKQKQDSKSVSTSTKAEGEEDASDEPVKPKKQKANDESAIKKSENKDDDDDEEEDDVEIDDEAEDAVEDDEDATEDGATEANDSLEAEEVDTNPIAASGKEEAELEGTVEDEVVEIDSSDEEAEE
ncbi:histone-fold-containing protein [Scheffersomyces xylosifermentans]|uniref:histone-fold-containing protein n=1 Tax=Scheffersomyces xylosifermentans TaxID=1304137 RepID=UPI00315C80E0